MAEPGSGIQWPCTDDAPEGTERLYTDHVFNTDPDHCEDYGHDLTTGAAFERADYTAIRPAGEAEAALAAELRSIGERHAAEADIYHLSHTLAVQCAEHLDELAPHAERYGAAAAPERVDKSPGLMETLRRKGSEAIAGAEDAGLLLMRDLRRLYATAQAAEIAWVILLQAARARRDPDLIDVASRCHEDAAMRGKWVRTRIKEAAPQVYATG